MKINLNCQHIFICFTISILLILLSIYFIGFIKANSKSEDGIIVLAYHHFLPEEDKVKYWPDNYYVMATEKFDEQMKYLKENDYVSVSPEQIECYLNKECEIPNKSFIVTIDDGNISSYYEALPVLEKYGFYSINFVISGRVEKTSMKLEESDLNTFYFLGEDLLEEIYNEHKSMTIASHSDSLHGVDENNKKLYSIKNYDELLEDAKKSKNKLFDTKLYAYPFGETNSSYKKSLEDAGYSLAFKFNVNRKIHQNDELYLLPRIDIRANYSLNDFVNRIEEKKTLKEYTKDILKKIKTKLTNII